jgi:membrane-associated phospholipid phosphatase
LAVGSHPRDEERDQEQTTSRLRRFTRFILIAFLNIATFMVCFQTYKLVRRSFAVRSERIGYDHADQIIRWEKALQVYFELNLQKWVLGFDHSVIIAFNRWYSFFMWAFYICCIIAMARAPEQYRRLRRIFFLSMLIALPWYALYPLAPPRFMTGEGFIDTKAVFGPYYLQGKGIIEANRFAAMPSMHVGWTTIGGIMLAVSFPWKRIGVVLGALLVGLMCFTVMVTGNHWFLDLIGGWTVVFIAFAVERRLPDRIEFPWFRTKKAEAGGSRELDYAPPARRRPEDRR